MRHKTAVCCQKLAETARAAGTTLNIDSPADWFRLAHVVLSCLPATVVRRSFVGICGRFDRYTFPECGHALHEDDDAAWIQQAPAERCSDLISALRARPPAAPLHRANADGPARVRCGAVRLAGPTHDNKTARKRDSGGAVGDAIREVGARVHGDDDDLGRIHN